MQFLRSEKLINIFKKLIILQNDSNDVRYSLKNGVLEIHISLLNKLKS